MLILFFYLSRQFSRQRLLVVVDLVPDLHRPRDRSGLIEDLDDSTVVTTVIGAERVGGVESHICCGLGMSSEEGKPEVAVERVLAVMAV